LAIAMPSSTPVLGITVFVPFRTPRHLQVRHRVLDAYFLSHRCGVIGQDRIGICREYSRIIVDRDVGWDRGRSRSNQPRAIVIRDVW